MAKSSKIKRFLRKLRDKYRLIVINDKTYEEVWIFKLSRLNVFAITSTAVILFTALIIVLVAYTPIREFIPGYPNGETVRNIRMNAIKLDSLEHQVWLKDQFIQNFRDIMEGKEVPNHDVVIDSPVFTGDIQDVKSEADSILREEVEEQQFYNLLLSDEASDNKDLSQIHFLKPLEGMITEAFNQSQGHIGIDLVASPESMVSATLDGRVIFTAFTVETGYVIQIQHDNNLISIYKHNAKLLKKQGDIVKAGDPIAVVGNSGELSTGPHLHFELLHKGVPINPSDYIEF